MFPIRVRVAIVVAVTGAAALAFGGDSERAPADSAAERPAGVPETFVELPEIAAEMRLAVKAVAGDDTGVRAHAWGDPAVGCYVTTTALELSGGDPARVYPALNQALEAAGFAVSEWVAGESGVRFDFAVQAMQGSMRVSAMLDQPENQGNDQASVLTLRATACLFSQRAPELSAGLCSRVLPAEASR